ncbi:hypothetical protein F4820DRAFT_467785 [Hypoxylon rubiginosum]|uniref:Uncharacterized protein n=1 Tax=Hypoxylon rubiginosum TaxID=110542 RepID=A0ACB9YI98_9PEZI|nr:hypothetical protein F4820DRAFT_467785 [Hypoxylon rubiginosum]
MDSESVHPILSAKTPILGNLARRFVEGLDDGASLDSLFPIVIEMAQEMGQELPGQGMSNIVKHFEDKESETHKQLRILFHTIHRKTLRSLVLGHTAHDFYNKFSSNWNYTYEKSGPGTYVIGLSIEGRRGAFLSWKEIEKVIGYIEEYNAGCEAWREWDSGDPYEESQPEPRVKEAIEKALIIDSEMESEEDKWKPGQRLIKPKGITPVKNIDALTKMLRRRVDRRFDENTPQTSSPAYTGCGRKMPRRMLGHDPDYGNFASTSTTLRILQSCIRHIGLMPLVTAVPVVVVWEQRHIGLSEELVTVLTRSMIGMDGFNVMKPGTVTTWGDTNIYFYEEAKRYVWIMTPWFGENLEMSIDHMQGMDIMQPALDTTQYISAEGLREVVDQLREDERKAKEIQRSFDHAEEEAKKRLDEAKKTLDRVDDFLSMSSGMFPNLSSDADDDEEDDADDDVEDDVEDDEDDED